MCVISEATKIIKYERKFNKLSQTIHQIVYLLILTVAGNKDGKRERERGENKTTLSFQPAFNGRSSKNLHGRP